MKAHAITPAEQERALYALFARAPRMKRALGACIAIARDKTGKARAEAVTGDVGLEALRAARARIEGAPPEVGA